MVNESCNCEHYRELDVSKITYWFEEGDEEKWPKKPKKIHARKIYTAKEDRPYCIYVLEHKITVPASSLKYADKRKFHVAFTTNNVIFPNFAQILKSTKEEADMLKSQLQFDSLLPKQYLLHNLSSFKQQIDDVCSKATDISALTTVQHMVTNLISRVTEKCSVKPSEERQLNTWVYEQLQPLFDNHGFYSWHSFPDTSYSVFGTSEPDLVFYKGSDGSAVAATVTFPSQEEDIVQSTVEYKKGEISEKHYCHIVRLMLT